MVIRVNGLFQYRRATSSIQYNKLLNTAASGISTNQFNMTFIAAAN